MLNELLEEYRLPVLPEQNLRENCLDILQKNEYGYIPDKPHSVKWKIIDFGEKNFAGGKTTPQTVEIYGETAQGYPYSFPIRVCIPNDTKKHSFFIHLNFRPDIPDKYQPTEEIIDNEFAVLSFCYKEVTEDNDDFSDGLSKSFYPDGIRHEATQPGKIAIWAWAAMRVMDFAHLAFADRLDFENSAVVGHSRLGKTALLTGAYDDRFKFVFSNCAGCSGDALERNKTVQDADSEKRAETVADITRVVGYWFCENYSAYANKADDMPFDQHFLTACIFPRYFMLITAQEDYWADPRNQFMNAVAVSKVYEKAGLKGLVCKDRLPLVGEYFYEGRIGYSLRAGYHSQTRTDWLHCMDFMKRHEAKDDQ